MNKLHLIFLSVISLLGNTVKADLIYGSACERSEVIHAAEAKILSYSGNTEVAARDFIAPPVWVGTPFVKVVVDYIATVPNTSKNQLHTVASIAVVIFDKNPPCRLIDLVDVPKARPDSRE